VDRYEAARALGLADADVLAVEETEDGTKVTTRDGGDRLIKDDGVFALSDHPATAQLRRHDADAADKESEPDDVPDPEPSTVPGDDEVPDGSADAVLTWVGDDSGRAQQALATEGRREHPRSTLVDKLRKIGA
jgi:hypothetical protein